MPRKMMILAAIPLTAMFLGFYGFEFRYGEKEQTRNRQPWTTEEHAAPITSYAGPCTSSPITFDTLDRAEDYFNEISCEVTAVNVPSLIHIHSQADASALRDKLIQFVWKEAGFPSQTLPQQVDTDVPNPLAPPYPPYLAPPPDPEYPRLGPPYAPLPNLQRVDRLTVTMDHGLQSTVYYFHPQQSNNRLVIWHQGHGDDIGEYGGHGAISFFLQRGYTVLALSMPMYGPNKFKKPIHIGGCAITGVGQNHSEFQCAETPAFTPMKYFVEPVAVALNHALSQQQYADTTMIGVSGGSWTTTVYAALDSRVRISIPVGGSLPEYLQNEYEKNSDDWEFNSSGLYTIANYLDIYILGSYGGGRKQLQILNKYDDCCFAGVRHRTYIDHIKHAVAQLGDGEFSVFLDDSVHPLEDPPSHRVSAHALNSSIIHTLNDNPVEFVDDGDNTYMCDSASRDCYRETGQWSPVEGRGFGFDSRLAYAATGAVAVWQFNVTPGWHQIAVTWDPTLTTGPNPFVSLLASRSAAFDIRDGRTLVKTVTVDQQKVPNHFSDAGTSWFTLGTYPIKTQQLEVHLSNNTADPVIADAVRLIRVEEADTDPRPLERGQFRKTSPIERVWSYLKWLIRRMENPSGASNSPFFSHIAQQRNTR